MTTYYRFYFNVDTGEIAQCRVEGERDALDKKFHDELHRLTGKYSDCYMPVSLSTQLFNKVVILPTTISAETLRIWKNDVFVIDASIVYPEYALEHSNCPYYTVPATMNTSSSVALI